MSDHRFYIIMGWLALLAMQNEKSDRWCLIFRCILLMDAGMAVYSLCIGK